MTGSAFTVLDVREVEAGDEIEECTRRGVRGEDGQKIFADWRAGGFPFSIALTPM